MTILQVSLKECSSSSSVTRTLCNRATSSIVMSDNNIAQGNAEAEVPLNRADEVKDVSAPFWRSFAVTIPIIPTVITTLVAHLMKLDGLSSRK
jgi:hypothetical protein